MTSGSVHTADPEGRELPDPANAELDGFDGRMRHARADADGIRQRPQRASPFFAARV